MSDMFRGTILTRDGLASGMTQLGRLSLKQMTWGTIASSKLPERGALIGSWGDVAGNPLPELLVVRDEDYADTLAWLGSYFGSMAPLTQWCRILTLSQADRIDHRESDISLGHRLSAWVGAVLAECSVQAGGAVNLKELPGSAALSSATFAAGRATTLWAHDVNFIELARRHDELSQSLREGARPVPAEALAIVWQVLSGSARLSQGSDRRALEPLSSLFDYAHDAGNANDTGELVQLLAREATEHFHLPELAECAKGPQVERVRALDRLAEQLLPGPRSPVLDALLGLGASFIDPGASVLPDLLRKHAQRLPLAPIWLGAFAGALAPLRVLSDHQGLGRLVAKNLLAPNDFQTRPACDIAYEELSRWISPGKSSQRLELRGMAARTLAVEIVPGVTCAFAHGRSEIVAAPSPTNTQRADVRVPPIDRTRNSGFRNLSDIDALVTNLLNRVERLEQTKAGGQASLDLPEPKDLKIKKGGRSSTRKI